MERRYRLEPGLWPGDRLSYGLAASIRTDTRAAEFRIIQIVFYSEKVQPAWFVRNSWPNELESLNT